MTLVRLALLHVCLLILAACATAIEKPQTAPVSPRAAKDISLDASVYKLASGDTVKVDVLGEPELSLKVLIDAAGFINYPFLGRVQAAGLTVGQLERRIYSGLKTGYLVNPDVRVAVSEYRAVYVSGQVRQAGAYPYSPGLTVDKAITLAGGITQFGSKNRIYRQRAGKQKEERENVGLDGLVYPGDTIVVDERLF